MQVPSNVCKIRKQGKPKNLQPFSPKNTGRYNMMILVACEESQTVTKELRRLGHEAFSCDIIDQSGGHPEWHIQGDVLPLLNGRCEFRTMDGTEHAASDRWDMIIAFPPCTNLAVSGARHFEKKRLDGRQRESLEFFCKFLEADCDRIAIENPVGIISGEYISEHFPELADKYGLPMKPTQIIQPYEFGDRARKTTCLWLRGLNPLVPTDITDPGEIKKGGFSVGASLDAARDENGKIIAWNDPRTGKIRSKTFPGIAKAMAEQWAGPCKDAGAWIDWPSCEYICSKCGRSSDRVNALPVCPNCKSVMRTNEVYPNFDCFVEENGYPYWWEKELLAGDSR